MDSTGNVDQSNQQTDIRAAIGNGRDILLQGFNRESHERNGTWWTTLQERVPVIAEYGFTSIWLPPATNSVTPDGYIPQNLYFLRSAYGNESQLQGLLQKMKQFKVRAMADIVINHRAATTGGHGGIYYRFDGIPLEWDEFAVTSNTGGRGNRSDGEIFSGAPNIDHRQDFVRADIKKWLQWLRIIGFDDFRFDLVKGYSGQYVREYIEGAKPKFSVGEYWDGDRQNIINWIDATGGLSTAFDLTTKGILGEAVTGQLWRLRDPHRRPPGVIGLRPSRAVTFVDNHYTGSTQQRWPFPEEHILEGYAYILTHPGTPTVFYDHIFERGDPIREPIVELMKVRKDQTIHSESYVTILEARENLYAAMIGSNVCMKIGNDEWIPGPGGGWNLATNGSRYAVWTR